MKKYYLKTIVVFCVLTVLFSFPLTKASLPLAGKIIVIDVGHGGKDPGTMAGEIYEKDINLKISLALEKELIKKGASVVLTRNGDYDLSKPNATRRKKSDFDNRIKIINSSYANMYVSIHLNYLPQTKYYGPQVFYNKKKENNKEIATIIQNELNKNLKTNRTIKEIPAQTYMYDKLNISGVLIECGFLSNFAEREKLTQASYQKELAKYIAKAIAMAI